MMFETTPTGYRATDEAVAFWQARDTCPACATPTSPAAMIGGVHYYECTCQDEWPGHMSPGVTWTRAAGSGPHS